MAISCSATTVTFTSGGWSFYALWFTLAPRAVGEFPATANLGRGERF